MPILVDARTEKLAKLCVRYCVEVKPKETVVIQGSAAAFPLIRAIYKECLINDAYPTVLANLDIQHTFFRHAKEHQLKFISPIERCVPEITDVSIRIHSDPNPKELSNIDAASITTHTSSRREVTEIFHKRVSEGKLRWTIVPYPINAQAQEASMSLQEFEDFVYGSCLVDKADPIREWKTINEQQKQICAFLNKAREITIDGEDTHLKLIVKGRKWISGDGRENMPDGEVFTGPVENSADGTIRFTFPGIVSGREVEDILLTFKDGRVVKASAAKGNDLLQQVLKIEGADRIGEIAVGTNYAITKFTKSMLFDEKMGGTIHMALGNSWPESGGTNKSAIHWDILKDMKKEAEISADGKTFYKNGKFHV